MKTTETMTTLRCDRCGASEQHGETMPAGFKSKFSQGTTVIVRRAGALFVGGVKPNDHDLCDACARDLLIWLAPHLREEPA